MDDENDIPTLGITDGKRKRELTDEIPQVCRSCRENLRIPGQYMCEACGFEKWGEETLENVLSTTRTMRGL